jgi:hypothetical protein
MLLHFLFAVKGFVLLIAKKSTPQFGWFGKARAPRSKR